jgi:indole-3-glycerol phosphate synthase
MILSRIIEEKRSEVERAKANLPLEDLKKTAASIYLKSAFRRNISRPHHINLIAELKKASPSKGILRGDFNPAKIVITYQANGACAISVITDERFFEGKLEYIKLAKEHVSVPILRKDFIIDEYQIYESLVAGADAVLLIADILSAEELKKLHAIATGVGLDCLVEVHKEEDLGKVLAAGADIIGINNRDLHTFRIDPSVTQRLIRLIPPGKTIVSESGIKTYEDVMFLKSIGVNAVLIGEAFMEAEDIGLKMRQVMRY